MPAAKGEEGGTGDVCSLKKVGLSAQVPQQVREAPAPTGDHLPVGDAEPRAPAPGQGHCAAEAALPEGGHRCRLRCRGSDLSHSARQPARGHVSTEQTLSSGPAPAPGKEGQRGQAQGAGVCVSIHWAVRTRDTDIHTFTPLSLSLSAPPLHSLMEVLPLKYRLREQGLPYSFTLQSKHYSAIGMRKKYIYI